MLDLRLPRSLTGALVGAALAVSGAITQSIARNPLASPDIIGLPRAPASAAVFVIVLGGGVERRRRRGFAAVGVPAGRAGRRAGHRRR